MDERGRVVRGSICEHKESGTLSNVSSSALDLVVEIISISIITFGTS